MYRTPSAKIELPSEYVKKFIRNNYLCYFLLVLSDENSRRKIQIALSHSIPFLHWQLLPQITLVDSNSAVIPRALYGKKSPNISLLTPHPVSATTSVPHTKQTNILFSRATIKARKCKITTTTKSQIYLSHASPFSIVTSIKSVKSVSRSCLISQDFIHLQTRIYTWNSTYMVISICHCEFCKSDGDASCNLRLFAPMKSILDQLQE